MSNFLSDLVNKYLGDKLYQYWRGIVTLFQPIGFIDRGIEPSKDSSDFDEVCATKITQNILFSTRTKIQQNLIPLSN